MSELKIVVELSPEDRARLDAILEELKSSRPNCERCVSTMSESWKHATAAAQYPVDAVPPATVEDVATAPAPAADPAPAVDPAPAAEEEKYTLEKVRSAVMTASRKSPEMKKKVKALLNQYSESVTKLPEADYPAFMTELKKLTEEAV